MAKLKKQHENRTCDYIDYVELWTNRSTQETTPTIESCLPSAHLPCIKHSLHPTHEVRDKIPVNNIIVSKTIHALTFFCYIYFVFADLLTLHISIDVSSAGDDNEMSYTFLSIISKESV